MTTLEYMQSIPETHVAHQVRVNDELWHRWNVIDHANATTDAYRYFCNDIFSPGVQATQEPSPADGVYDANTPPPVLSLHYSVSSRRWMKEQENYMDARIGMIIFVKDATPSWDPRIYITYAMQRVDTPYRWVHYCIHHMPNENFSKVIEQYTQ